MITALDPPRLLEYTWGESLLRWESRPVDQGCLLVFTHTFDTPHEAATFAAGWHVCLDALESALAGEPVAESRPRWATLHADYSTRFA